MPENDAGLKAQMQKAATEAGAGDLQKSTVEEDVPTGEEEIQEEEKDEPQEEKKDDDKPSPFAPLAKEWGWKPEKEFKADPDNEGKQWVSAEDYVRNIKPISDSYRKGQRELQRQLEQSTKMIQSLVSKQEAADKRAAEAEKRAKQEILSELNNKLDAAVDDQNKDEARKLTQQIATLTSEINAPEPPVAKKEKEGGEDDLHVTGEGDEGAVPASKSPTVARWMGRNEKSSDNPNGWYNDTDDPVNAALTLYADKRSVELSKDEDGNPRTWKDIFGVLDVELIKKREALQARIAPPKARQEGSSAGGGTPVSNKDAKVSDLSDEEVKAGRQFVRRGAFKNMAEYAKALRS